MIMYWLLAFVLVVIGTGLWLRLGLAGWFIDQPVSRSSHQRPTVRGGGVVFVTIFLLAAIPGLLPEWQSPLSLWQLMFIGSIMLVGLIDDFAPLSAILRLIIQLVVCSLLLWPAAQQFGWSGFLYTGLTLCAVWLVNLYNFMDGIDGLAAIQSICVAVGMALVFWWHDQLALSQFCLLLVAVSLGFLIWNFPQAKVFMGDAGSCSLGVIFATLVLLAGEQMVTALCALLLLMSVFIVDASWTLLMRFCTGQKIWTAHNLHAYQKLSRQLNSHVKVTMAVLAYNLIWLIPLTLAFITGHLSWQLAVTLSITPVLFACLYLQAGRLPKTTGA
jgi:Fuc2NAc and GlcNAc transferase